MKKLYSWVTVVFAVIFGVLMFGALLSTVGAIIYGLAIGDGSTVLFATVVGIPLSCVMVIPFTSISDRLIRNRNMRQLALILVSAERNGLIHRLPRMAQWLENAYDEYLHGDPWYGSQRECNAVACLKALSRAEAAWMGIGEAVERAYKDGGFRLSKKERRNLEEKYGAGLEEAVQRHFNGALHAELKQYVVGMLVRTRDGHMYPHNLSRFRYYPGKYIADLEVGTGRFYQNWLDIYPRAVQDSVLSELVAEGYKVTREGSETDKLRVRIESPQPASA